MTILLIDDEKSAMRYYIRALEDAGFEVDHQRTTDGALLRLRKAHESIAVQRRPKSQCRSRVLSK